ncbi:MAG: T9SS type A sorting domain-containing protein, partial [Bacteroidia bacterium]
DFGAEDYKGAYYTGCVTSKRTSPTGFTFTTNLNSPFRTTAIGTFTTKITNLAVSDNSKSLLLTASDKVANQRIYLSTPNVDLDNVDNTVVTFSDKTGNLPAMGVYCALFEMTDNKRVLIGTDRGVFSTNDIESATPTWNDAKNNYLPNVQVFDLKQQKMTSWDSYNSGVIYAATYGRGAWVNKNYLNNTVIGVEEHEIKAQNNGLILFPNPANTNVTVSFYAMSNEDATINVYDLNGRVVKSEVINNMNLGYKNFTVNTEDIPSGVYIVNVAGTSGTKRVSKLIINR